ncbi:T9SS type A sorting domain-containing protein [Lewinella sp. IMCC34183]|uniref:T9SS type A sorting domain-containing protein n=1 Tax=Lewinella sp. IMCC34183 TaxID=2248762 RepID=UPI000E25485A|nr:T9SS type A sorting domain-containing protein [Lewinella sp. IMCC34183]
MKYLSTLLLFCALSTCVRAQTYVSVEKQDSVPRSQLTFLAGPYNVVNYKVRYRTIDTQGQPDTASGLLTIPYDRGLEFPLGAYMHGTVTNREAVPSRMGVTERTLVDLMASYGYVMVAPDYLGLGDNEGFHPYVHAASEASAGRDLLLAARQWLAEQKIPYNDQLFLTGYSQGGHAVQALHRDIQENPGDDDLTVTAATHLSGPYSISDVMRRAAFEEEPATLPGYIIYTYVSYDNVYGIYDNLGEVFKEPYLDVIEDFNMDVIDGTSFNNQLYQLLEDRDERLADMFQDSIRQQLEENDPDSRIIQALRDNDTYDWAPEAPTLLYYCTDDEQVPFENAILADSVMRINGSTTVMIESGGERSHTECVQPALLRTLGLFEGLASRSEVATATGRPVRQVSLSVSPNPVSVGGVVRVSGLTTGAYTYTLYDAAGRNVQRGTLPADGSLSVSARAVAGLHLLRINLPDGNFAVRKVMLR